MESIKNLAFKRALAMLDASGSKYFIIDPEGVEHKNVDFEVVQKKRQRVVSRPYGAMVAYYKKFLETVEPGGYTKVPATSEFTLQELRCGVTAWCTANWGRKTYMSNTREDGIEVLRLDITGA